jgi:hypothetical protein
MMDDKEVIALLPHEDRPRDKQVPRALVRFPDGRMAVEELESDTTKSGQYLARFRRLAPIIDPATREVIGYELEQFRPQRA